MRRLKVNHSSGTASSKVGQQEIEKEQQEIEAMMAENDRNLQEARRAIKDRGWDGGVSQRPYKPTSTDMSKGRRPA